MPAGDDLFCQTYAADPNVRTIIDTSQDDFYVRYRSWEDAGKPRTVDDMVAYFGYWGDAETALNKGDTTLNQRMGGVLQDDCTPFNEFVGLKSFYNYSHADIAQLKKTHSLLSTNDPMDVAFEAALVKYFRGDIGQLSKLEKALLNGALLIRVKLAGTDISDSKPDEQLYAIPGHLVFGYRRNLRDATWIGVDKIVLDAFDKVGSRLINVYGAVQLRLADPNATFGPIDVAPGFVIMGRV